MAEDTPQSKLASAREMISKSGKPMTTENLNRASLALSRGESTTDFDGMLERAANPPSRSSSRRVANTNKPTETAKGGDGPGPTGNTNVQQTTAPAQAAAADSGTMPAVDAMGNVTGGVMPTVTASTSDRTMPIEDYVTAMLGGPDVGYGPTVERGGGGIPSNPASAMSLPLEDRPAPGSVAPVQSNPSANAAAVETPQAAQPVVADAAQQPMREKLNFESLMNDPSFRAVMPMLMGGRGPNTGAGVAGGARGAVTNPLPRGPLSSGSVNPPGPSGLAAPPPQGALPSSYGPPIPRGNLNTAPPQGPISVPMGGNNAIRMGTSRPIGQPRIGTDRGNVGRQQGTAQQRLSAILRSRGQ